MKTFTSTLLAASAMGANAAAMPSSQQVSTVAGKLAPDNFGFIDITNGIPDGPPVIMTSSANSSPLEARRNVDYCIRDPARSGVCVGVASVLAAVGSAIASNLKTSSNNHDCSTHTGSIDNVTWSTYATGQNCDTTAQLSTIAGSIDNYMRAQNDNICGTHCIKLTHGGTWTGYVTLAPAGTDLSSYYCGSSSTFGSCGTGGEGDNHN